MRRFAVRFGSVLMVALVVAAGATAFFASSGARTAAAGAIGSVNAPTGITTVQTGANVAVGWNAATLSSGGAVGGYTVKRSDGSVVCGIPTPVTVLNCTDSSVASGTYTYSVTAVFHTFTRSTTSGSIAILAAPTITAKPANPSATSTASFSFTSASTYQCQIDGGTFTSCTSPKSYFLVSGSHTFAVRAIQGASIGPSTAYAWTIATSAPSITAQPANPSPTSAPSFSFTHTQAAFTFTCQRDSGTIAPCTSPIAYSGLTDGSHLFVVRAADANGALTASAGYSWTVDATAPNVSLSSSAGLMWANNTSPSTIGFANADGTSPNQSLVTGLPNTRGTFSDGRYLWWASDNGAIGRSDRDGSNVIASFVTGAGSFIPGMTSDGTYLYWGDRNSNRIGRIALNAASGTSPTFIVTGASAPYGVTVSGTHIYWTQQNSSVGRANLDGTGVNNSFLSSFSQSVGITADSSNLWIGDASTQQIFRVGLDASGNTTGSPTVIVSGTSRPFSMKTDGTFIYWSNQGGGSVGRAALDGSGANQSFITGGNTLWTAAYVPASTLASISGSTVYYNGSVAGSLTMADAVTDSGTGPASVTYPAIATTGWTHGAETVNTSSGASPTLRYTSKAFSWTASPGSPTGYSVGSADAAGNLTSTPLTFVNDTTSPTGGALAVGGVTAAAGGATGAAPASFSIGTRVDYSEAASATQAGLRSSTLTVQSTTLTGSTCGASGSGGPFTSITTVTGSTQPAGITTGFCYRYTLTGTDKVGNTTSVTATVRVPVPPTVASTNPTAKVQGSTGSVLIAGTGFQNGATFSFSGSGVTVVPGTVSFVSSTQLSATVAVAGTATSGARDVTVTNADGGVGTGTALFSVTPAFTAAAGSPFATTAAANPRQVTFSPAGGRLAATNGGSSNVSVFSVNSSTGALTQVSGSPFATGATPYGVAFSPSGDLLATANFDANTVSVFSVNATTGALTQVAGSPFPTGSGPVSVAFSPNGGRLAIANFFGSSVSEFAVNATTGALTQVAGSPFATGANPRWVAYSPNSSLLAAANYNADTVSVFSVNASTGALTQVAGSPATVGVNPASLAFSPDNGLLAVSNVGSNTVSMFAINSSTGAPTQVTGSPFTTTAGLVSLAFSPSGGLLTTVNASTVSLFYVNASTGALTAGSTATTGTNPTTVAFSPGGGLLATSNFGSNSISVFLNNTGV
ncbi:MAG: hypothetical protein JWO02_3216 [Solirubrobacterales bacterium]|nr:hypothetical protein [Solirubrobacterales bacterium]